MKTSVRFHPPPPPIWAMLAVGKLANFMVKCRYITIWVLLLFSYFAWPSTCHSVFLKLPRSTWTFFCISLSVFVCLLTKTTQMKVQTYKRKELSYAHPCVCVNVNLSVSRGISLLFQVWLWKRGKHHGELGGQIKALEQVHRGPAQRQQPALPRGQ